MADMQALSLTPELSVHNIPGRNLCLPFEISITLEELEPPLRRYRKPPQPLQERDQRKNRERKISAALYQRHYLSISRSLSTF